MTTKNRTAEPGVEIMPDPTPAPVAQLGAVSPELRVKMGEALADVFDDFGPEIYNGVVLAVKESLKTAFDEGAKQIEDAVTKELGERGIRAAQKYFRAWMEELLVAITSQGLADAALAAADEASTLAAEFPSTTGTESAPDLPGLADIEKVPLAPPAEVETIEEKPAEATENAAPAFEEETTAEPEMMAAPEAVAESPRFRRLVEKINQIKRVATPEK
jgi:hypothetical protein